MKKVKSVGTIIVLISAISFGFSGCTVTYPTIKYNDMVEAGNKIVTHPKLHEIATAEIGSNIYSKSKMFFNNTYQITLKESAVGQSGYASINYNVDTNPTLSSILYQWNEPYGNTLCGVGTVNAVCLTDKDNTGSFTHVGNFIYGAYGALNKSAKYEIKATEGVHNKNGFKYEAFYQGKKGNSIKISFREFVNDMARPAFTQDIDYELEKDGNTIVGFKGLRIEVIKATNLNITYKIIRDYD